LLVATQLREIPEPEKFSTIAKLMFC